MLRLFCLFFVALGLLTVGCNGGDAAPDCNPDVVTPRESCTMFCEVGIECDAFNTPQSVCEGFCECQLLLAEDTSAACGDAWTAETICVAALNCDGFALFAGQIGDYPCREEVTATDSLCFGVETL